MAHILADTKLLCSRSVVPTMEDFDPALFMTVIHATASFNDIRNGLESLNGAKANQVRAPCHALAFCLCACYWSNACGYINTLLAHFGK